MKLNQTTMRTQNEKLQRLVNSIKDSSKVNSRLAKSASEDHSKGLFKGYADAYELTAGWIQKIIDLDKQT